MRYLSYIPHLRTNKPEILALFAALCNVMKPRTFGDIGAFVGFYSFLLKSWDMDVDIIMFEPDPINFDCICQTIRKTGMGKIKCLPYGVSDKDGEGMFAVDRVRGATGTLEDPKLAFTARHNDVLPSQVPVRRITIDSMRTHERPIDLMKIDVEGHEESVIKGAEQTLVQDSPVVFECFHADKPIVSRLHDLGYTFLDAERMVDNLERTTNFLALPPRYSTAVQELVTVWEQAYEALWT